MDKNVRYHKEMRDRAKKDGKVLITLATTHKSGRPAITFQGPASEEQAKQVENLICELLDD